MEFEKPQAEQLSGKSLGAIPKQSQTFLSPVQPQIGSIWSSRVSDLCKRIADHSKGHRWHLGSERSCVGVTVNNDTSLFTFQAFRTKLGRIISYTVYPVATFIFESTNSDSTTSSASRRAHKAVGDSKFLFFCSLSPFPWLHHSSSAHQSLHSLRSLCRASLSRWCDLASRVNRDAVTSGGLWLSRSGNNSRTEGDGGSKRRWGV